MDSSLLSIAVPTIVCVGETFMVDERDGRIDAVYPAICAANPAVYAARQMIGYHDAGKGVVVGKVVIQLEEFSLR